MDCLAFNGHCVYFIEFKRMPAETDKLREVKDSIRMKSVESLHLCGKFIPGIMAGRKSMLIVVDQNPVAEIVDACTLPDDTPMVPGYLRRYMACDTHGEKLFFDDVASMHTATFVRFANENLRKSY